MKNGEDYASRCAMGLDKGLDTNLAVSGGNSGDESGGANGSLLKLSLVLGVFAALYLH
jgi:hypothetical protein